MKSDENPLVGGQKPLVVQTGDFDTTMNIINAILGAGIVGIANSFNFAGVTLATLIMGGIGTLSYVTAILVTKIQKTKDYRNLSEMSADILGVRASYLLSFCYGFFCICCMTAYLVLSVDILVSWLNLIGIHLGAQPLRGILTIVYGLIGPVALTCPRKLDWLSAFSFMAVVSLTMFMVIMAYKFWNYTYDHDAFAPTVVGCKIGWGIFNTIAIDTLTFSTAIVIVPVIQPATAGLKRRYTLLGIGQFVSFVIVLIPGVVGYLMFGEDARPNIMNSFSDDDLGMVIVRIGFFIVLIASYPCLGLSVITLFSRIITGDDKHEHVETKKRALVLAASNACPLLVAAILPNVRPAMAVGGAVGGGLANFVYPPVMYVVTELRKPDRSMIGIVVFSLVTVFGLFSTVAATWQSIVDAIYIISNPDGI